MYTFIGPIPINSKMEVTDSIDKSDNEPDAQRGLPDNLTESLETLNSMATLSSTSEEEEEDGD